MMAEHGRDFDLDQLDQQIEHPGDSLNAEAQQLVKALQQMGRPPQSEMHANARSLQLVRRRLQARFESTHQETTILPFHVLQTPRERISFMDTSVGKRKPGLRRFLHTLNTLAAVLVVAVLIGSVVVLFNLNNHAHNSLPNTQTGASAQSTSKPLPKPDCSHVFTEDRGFYPDHGEHAVCLQGEETPLQGTATLNGHKLTLISAYADTNRLLVRYVVTGRDPFSVYNGATHISHLLMQDPAQTLSVSFDQNTPWSFGGGVYYDSQKNQTFVLESFSTQQVAAGTTTLQVTADFTTIVGATHANPEGTDQDKASFTFPVPLHTQKRVATPNQSTVINGHRLTLSQVVITPSATYLFVKMDRALTASPASNMMEAAPSATINGNSNVIGAFTTNGIGVGKWEPVTGFSLGIPEDWMNQPTSWTMSLRSLAPPLGEGSGTLQFTVPR